jgi:hypothetical protein
MTEIWLFGSLVTTLGTRLSLFFLIVACSAVSYLALTLIPTLSFPAPASAILRGARWAGLAAGAATLAVALAGLRVDTGAAHALTSSLGLSAALSVAAGTTTALAWLLAARGALTLGATRRAQQARLQAARDAEAKQLEAGLQRFQLGDDLRAEVAEARGAVERLHGAVERLRSTRDGLEQRLAEATPEAPAELGAELSRARVDVATKISLGERILGAAEAAAFRLACSEPVKRLLRQRPRELSTRLQGLDELGHGAASARIEAATSAIDAFLLDAEAGRERLRELAAQQLVPHGYSPAPAPDACAQASRNLEAIVAAYAAVGRRLHVVRLRLAAREEMEEVASAAGQLEGRARASGLDASELAELLGEVARAESAISMATPGEADEADEHRLAETLLHSTQRFDDGDGASVEQLLAALRELG